MNSTTLDFRLTTLPNLTVSRDASLPQIIATDNGIAANPQDAPKIFDHFIIVHSRNKYEDGMLGFPLRQNTVLKHRRSRSSEAIRKKEKSGSLMLLSLKSIAS